MPSPPRSVSPPAEPTTPQQGPKPARAPQPKGKIGTGLPLLALGLGTLAVVLVVGLVVLAITVGTRPVEQQARVPPRPVDKSGSAPGPAQAPRVRPTPDVQVRSAIATDDVVEAGQAYVVALYEADDATAALYMPGFGSVLRKDEDTYILDTLSARPMTWGEAGYTDADPTLQFAEVVARVRARDGSTAGNVYYKLGFKRTGDGLAIDLASRRLDVREVRS